MAFDNCSLASLKNVSPSDCPPLLATRKLIFTTADFSFADIDAAKLSANFTTGICNKQIFPFPLVQSAESANEDAVFEILETKSIQVTPAKKQTQFTFVESLCVHADMRSFNGRQFRLFEVTEGDFVTGIKNSDGSIKGQLVQVFVDILGTSTFSEVGKTLVDIRYNEVDNFEQNAVVFKLDTPFSNVNGIVDVELAEEGTSLATQLNISVIDFCSGESVDSLVDGDLVVKNGAGVVQVLTSTTYNATEGYYELVGTGFANGFTVEVNGVIAQPDAKFEGKNIVTIATI